MGVGEEVPLEVARRNGDGLGQQPQGVAEEHGPGEGSDGEPHRVGPSPSWSTAGHTGMRLRAFRFL